MFDLSKLKIRKRSASDRSSYSFVGVRKDPLSGELEFWMPQGFEDFPSTDFDQVVKYFFLIYGSVRKFAKVRGLLDDKRTPQRDGFFARSSSVVITLAEGGESLTFTKLSVLEDLVNSFDEMVLAAIIAKQRPGPLQQLDKIHLHMDRAVFLPDHSFMLDAIPSQRLEVEDGASALIGMFSYVYVELISRIDPAEQIHPEIRARAMSFQEEHLAATAGLFEQGSFQTVIAILKEQLESIHRRTSYKDADYWRLFDALEFFLYGDVLASNASGMEVWGVSDFFPIWEEMCIAVLEEHYSQGPEFKVYYTDKNRSRTGSMGQSEFKDDYPFVLRYKDEKRRIYPDFVGVRDPARSGDRASFDALFRTRLGPLTKGVYAYLRVSANTDQPVATTWVEGLKPKLAKQRFTPRVNASGAIELKNIPQRAVRDAFDSLYQDYLGRKRRGKAAWFIVDAKYVSPLEFTDTTLSTKLRNDIRKQLVYELALTAWLGGVSTKSRDLTNQFAVPRYDPAESDFARMLIDDPPATLGRRSFNSVLLSSGIELVAIPFHRAADVWMRWQQ